MNFVPRLQQSVLHNAYTVQQDDDVGSISAGFVGCPYRYPELVGANLHKGLVDNPELSHKVFAVLHPGELLNIPGHWAGHGIVGCTPKDCVDAGAQCGPAPDGCGGILHCGMCQPPQECVNGACVNPPGRPGGAGRKQETFSTRSLADVLSEHGTSHGRGKGAGHGHMHGAVGDVYAGPQYFGNVPQGMLLGNQLTALATVLVGFIQAGAASLPPKWNTSGIDVPNAAAVLVSWWPYLNIPPNNLGNPADIDLAQLSAWMLDPHGAPTFANLLAAAGAYWNNFKTIPNVQWDRVPWAQLTAAWPAMTNAYGGNVSGILSALQFTSKINTVPWQAAPSRQMKFTSGTLQTAYPPPNFINTDWSKPPYSDLISWITQGYTNPDQVPWDLILSTGTMDCLTKNPTRLDEMQADPCWQTPGGCDPIAQFKTAICADKYVSGWCEAPPCKMESPGQNCNPKTCMQLGVTCGPAADGCGGSLDCGACPSGQTCVNGKCVEGTGTGGAPAESSTWKYVLGVLGVAALAVGGYFVMGGTKKNPSYKTNDPRGWGGDPTRGAALGRPSIRGSKDFAGRLTLRRIHLDSGGYDSNGTYFGSGAPLFWYASEDGEIDDMLRARDREAAKQKILQEYPSAKFLR